MSRLPERAARTSSGLDEQAKRQLIDALRGGADIDTASLFAGLNANDFTPDLWDAIFKARAEAIVRAVAQIQKAANQGDWKAAAWWLERSMPTVYGQKRASKGTTPVRTFTCPEGHTVTTSRDDSDSTPVCGICFEPMA